MFSVFGAIRSKVIVKGSSWQHYSLEIKKFCIVYHCHFYKEEKLLANIHYMKHTNQKLSEFNKSWAHHIDQIWYYIEKSKIETSIGQLQFRMRGAILVSEILQLLLEQ